MKLSVSAYRAHASAHKKILSSGYHSQLNYGSTGPTSSSSATLHMADPNDTLQPLNKDLMQVEGNDVSIKSPSDSTYSNNREQLSNMKHLNKDDDDNNSSNTQSSDSKSSNQRKCRIGDGASDPESDWNRSNQRWMKLRTTVQISSAIQKKPPLKREDSFLKRFSTRQIPETQETVEDTGSESAGDHEKTVKRRRRYLRKRRSVVNPDENFYFYWLMILTICILYNLWTLIVRQSFPELQNAVPKFWLICDHFTDVVFIIDIIVQLRTGYLEQGLMVYDDKKLACHYVHSKDFFFDVISLVPFDLLQLKMGTNPLLRFTRFFKVYRSIRFYYIVESRTVWPNLWRVVNLIHILLILAHWFGCFYYLLSEAEGFQGDWVYPYRPGDYATLSRKYLGSLYWSTLTLTTIGDLPTPETNAEYIFTIVSYLIGVFIFATIVGQVGNVITNRNANRLEFERLLDGAKTYMRHHKVPGGMKRRVLRWYDYSWSRGRIQGGGDINTALGLLPDKLKTELALHVNLSVLKKVTIFQECQPEFLHDLVLKMKAYIFTPGDSICRKGEVAREMFIIADGILEVLSETGKVLTTMKAGDFFGEIGILNLDGLNKRTADVRSVGYSELFSLSREDVLAAMKDYPEAQEILQSLGRKRLMEVRCVNKKYAKAQNDKENAANPSQNTNNNNQHINSNDQGHHSSRKVVNRIKSDVRGLKNVLRKSRRKSDESMEMQPLHSTARRDSKSVLKRMPRVSSDEKDDSLEAKEELYDKNPSPIGAGLPLLQRLRLLKEKQDREERAVKSTPSQNSPTHTQVTNTLSPQESIQEEPEREINESLPIIQRLQQLKFKNDAVADETQSSLSNASGLLLAKENKVCFKAPSSSGNQTLITAALTTTSSLPTTGTAIIQTTTAAATATTSALATTTQAIGAKPPVKVSFKQRLQRLQSTGKLKSSTKTMRISEKNISSSPNGKRDPPKSLSIIIKKNSLETDVVDPSGIDKPIKSLKPNAKILLKPSASKKYSNSLHVSSTPVKPWSKLKLATLISSSYTSLTNTSPEKTKTAFKNYSASNIPNIMKSDIIPAELMERHTKANNRHKTIFSDSKICKKTKKFYQSVFDLSPEYNGLPFVKRLKILNERQKLAELETVLQTRSFSLDSSKTQTQMLPESESLYRCYSDTSGIFAQYLSAYESSSTASTNTSKSESSRLEFVQHEYMPLSPESNETVERRKLKSILKKMSKNERKMEKNKSRFSQGLPMDPTLEGPPYSYEEVSTRSCLPLPPDMTATSHSQSNFRQSMQDNETVQASLAPPFAPYAYTTHNPNSIGIPHECQLKSNVPPSAISPDSVSLLEQTQNIPYANISKLEGVPEAHQYFNQILIGINNVIKTHINEMHSKFESQFSSMACEVRKRDAIIAHLQKKLRCSELKVANNSISKSSDDESSSETSTELPFMRGDSLDTVFTSSPVHKKTCDTSSPKNLCKLVGNLQRPPDSVILDIGDSSSSSSSSLRLTADRNGDDDDDDEDDDDEERGQTNKTADATKRMHHNDWEVRMLAEEMEKQERKRGFSFSEHLRQTNPLDGSLRHRRRKFSDTEAEVSGSEVELDNNAAGRKRAASLDQFNMRYGHEQSLLNVLKSEQDKDNSKEKDKL